MEEIKSGTSLITAVALFLHKSAAIPADLSARLLPLAQNAAVILQDCSSTGGKYDTAVGGPTYDKDIFRFVSLTFLLLSSISGIVPMINPELQVMLRSLASNVHEQDIHPLLKEQVALVASL
jgi:hypothetical protein